MINTACTQMYSLWFFLSVSLSLSRWHSSDTWNVIRSFWFIVNKQEQTCILYVCVGMYASVINVEINKNASGQCRQSPVVILWNLCVCVCVCVRKSAIKQARIKMSSGCWLCVCGCVCNCLACRLNLKIISLFCKYLYKLRKYNSICVVI